MNNEVGIDPYNDRQAPMDAPQHWQVEALWQRLSPLLPGVSIEVVARTESTNTALLERVRKESRGENQAYGRRSHDMQPCLLVAEHQTQGRGRMGRPWVSAPGASLTFSLGVVLDMEDWSGLSLAVGCAVADALEPLESLAQGQAPRLQLKWPNDIWLVNEAGGRKLGGILIETVPAGSQRMAIVGIGLNVTEQAAGASHDGPGGTAFNTGFAALSEFSPPDAAALTAPAVLARIAPALAQALHDFPRSGFAPWQAAYTRRDLTLGHAISAGTLEGISRGVDAAGNLLVETAGGAVQAVNGGEVSVRLASTTAAAGGKA